MKKAEERLTGTSIRISLRPADKALIDEAARRAGGRGEVSEWCRSVLVPAAKAVLSGDAP